MLTAVQLKEHVLNRVGYGPGLAHSARYDRLGPASYISQQLTGGLEELALGPADVFINTKLARSVLAPRQLEAVLLDFWYNHFNIDAVTDIPRSRANLSGSTIDEFQNSVIAPNLLGSFGEMLTATAKSAAMLRYLDNNRNRKPDVLADGTLVGYNDNYARELMELHTIGVDGGYTERDVQEAARILTGWTTTNMAFIYRDGQHDDEAKTILGVNYPAGGGIEEGEEFLAFLAAHPSAAGFLSRKLCVRFVGEDPPASAVDAGSVAFAQTNGDLGATTTAILGSTAFVDPAEANFRSKVKPPHRFVASALMAMGASSAADWAAIESALVQRIVDAGDTPYLFGPPTGYPEDSRHWLAPSSMLVRFEIAELIAYEPALIASLRRRSGANGSDLEAAFAAVQQIAVPGGVSSTTEAAVKDHAAANAVTNDQRLSAIAHMLLASPEFLRY